MSHTALRVIKAVGRRVRRLVQRDPDFFLPRVKGVIHVGANLGQERDLYTKHNLNVLWVEPIPDVFEQLKLAISPYPQQKAICRLITDADGKEYEFHISDSGGVSSSIFEFAEHKELWPQISFVNTVRLKGMTLPSAMKQESIDASLYDALVLDTQGSELLVLKGAIEMLARFKFIKLEAADFEAYRGCCRLSDLESFLGQHGFRPVAKRSFAHKRGVGSCYDVTFEQDVKRSRSPA